MNKNFIFILFGISLIIYSSVQIASSNTIFYYTTTEAYENVDVSESERLKLGGFVVSDSVTKTNNAETRFTVTDGNKIVTIIFDGFIPDLFQEEMGVILDGYFQNEIFYSVLLSLIFGFSFLISFYHFGIEQGFINESNVCGSNKLDLITKEDILKSLKEININCKDVTFKILGLSLTSYNILVSIIMFVTSIKIYLINNEVKK